MKNFKYLVQLSIVSIVFMSCSPRERPELINEEEVITTTIVSLTAAGQPNVTLTSRDADGDGPGAPIVEVSGNLKASVTYAGTVKLLNETENPAEDITLEVRDEAVDHQFFFQSNTSLNITTTYTDMDSNGNPVGINFRVTAGQPSTGSFTVILRHLPSKDADGVADGDITNAGGETDITQTFNLSVE